MNQFMRRAFSYVFPQLGEIIMQRQDIRDHVARQQTVILSMHALLGSIAVSIRDKANDQAALRDLADSIDNNTKMLADDVVANTPAADPSAQASVTGGPQAGPSDPGAPADPANDPATGTGTNSGADASSGADNLKGAPAATAGSGSAA